MWLMNTWTLLEDKFCCQTGPGRTAELHDGERGSDEGTTETDEKSQGNNLISSYSLVGWRACLLFAAEHMANQ